MNKNIIVTFIILIMAITAQAFGDQSFNKDDLVNYLKNNWKSPEEYIVSKFEDHDYVFIGEWHRIKHDVILIQNLIPLLYRAGVYAIGSEFTAFEQQELADKLVTEKTYDENLARKIMFKSYAPWGYVEYLDLFRKAWELNQTLPSNAVKFRIVGLNFRSRYDLITENMTEEEYDKLVLLGTTGDEFMAKTIKEEFLDKNQKALIYMGIHHAFTKYRMPMDDPQTEIFEGYHNRTGNIINDLISNRVFTIFLHSPWFKVNPENQLGFDFIYPVDGIIDDVMENFTNQRVGFDVIGTPFEPLKSSENPYYKVSYNDFHLGSFCDGYVFQKQFEDYESITVDENYLSEDSLEELNAFSPGKNYKSIEEFIERLKEGTAVVSLIRDLAK